MSRMDKYNLGVDNVTLGRTIEGRMANKVWGSYRRKGLEFSTVRHRSCPTHFL